MTTSTPIQLKPLADVSLDTEILLDADYWQARVRCPLLNPDPQNLAALYAIFGPVEPTPAFFRMSRSSVTRLSSAFSRRTSAESLAAGVPALLVRAAFLAPPHPAVQRVLGHPDPCGHLHHREPALDPA